MNSVLVFFCCSFNFGPSALCACIVSVIQISALNYLYMKPFDLGEKLGEAYMLVFLLVSLMQTFLIIQWAGLLYVDAETVRIGNENLLDNLKEGVVILCQDN